MEPPVLLTFRIEGVPLYDMFEPPEFSPVSDCVTVISSLLPPVFTTSAFPTVSPYP